jgi:hypothetical protein
LVVGFAVNRTRRGGRRAAARAITDPLLEDVIDLGGLGDGDVLLAVMFLAPVRHAGAGGDIAAILDAVRSTHPALH